MPGQENILFEFLFKKIIIWIVFPCMGAILLIELYMGLFFKNDSLYFIIPPFTMVDWYQSYLSLTANHLVSRYAAPIICLILSYIILFYFIPKTFFLITQKILEKSKNEVKLIIEKNKFRIGWTISAIIITPIFLLIMLIFKTMGLVISEVKNGVLLYINAVKDAYNLKDVIFEDSEEERF